MAGIWGSIREYMRLEWAALDSKRVTGSLDFDSMRLFHRRYGNDPETVSFVNGRIEVVLIPNLFV